jgi:hypothetical protein
MDMTVVSTTAFITLDTWNNTISGVNLMPLGSAMKATMNAGVVPVSNNPLTWTVKTMNANIGQVLVIALPAMYGAGA